MKTCLTVDLFPSSGGSYPVAYANATCLSRKGKVSVVAIKPHGFSEAAPFDVLSLNLIRDQPAPFSLPGDIMYCMVGAMKLLKIRKKEGLDLIFSQDMVFTGLYSSIFGRIFKVRTIVADYGPCVNYADWSYRESANMNKMGRALNGIQRLAAMSATKLTSRIAREFLITGVEHDRFLRQTLGDRCDDKVMYYDFGVDTERFQPATPDEKAQLRESLGLQTDSIVVTITSRLVGIKGLDYMFEVLMKLCKETNGLQIMIVGDGPLRPQLEAVVESQGLTSRFRFVGAVPWETIHSYLQASDVYLYGGTAGSCVSLGVLEAMATGCAVVASNSPRAHEVILDGNNGICFHCGDAFHLEEHLKSLIGSECKRERVSMDAVRYVREHNSNESLCERLSDILTGKAERYSSWTEYHRSKLNQKRNRNQQVVSAR